MFMASKSGTITVSVLKLCQKPEWNCQVDEWSLQFVSALSKRSFWKTVVLSPAKNRWFWRKLAEILILHSTHKNKGFCSAVLAKWINYRVPPPGSVRLRFGDGTVPAVPAFGSGGSSKEAGFLCFSIVSQRGRFRFRFRFLENGSGGSGSAFGSCEIGSDGSGFRFRFGSWATLCNLPAQIKYLRVSFPGHLPWSSFPCFLDFLAFFVARNFLAVFERFSLLSQGLFWFVIVKNPCFFGWFSLLFPKRQGKEDQGKAGHNRAGRSDFRNQRFEPDSGKMQKMQKVPLTAEKQGSEEMSQHENAEKADTKT